jgi:FlaA1/EpsC-like NDP-sugar epimerase
VLQSATVGRDAVTATEKDPDRSQTAGLTPDASPVHRSVNGSWMIAVLASRVRAKVLFMVLDAVCVVGGYSAAEVFYWRHVAPTEYGWHFGIFVLIVVIVTLTSNRMFGLYGRIWRHAGLEEARQMILSSATVAVVLAVLYPIIRAAGFQLVHPEVVLVGLLLATLGMSVLRFHSRIFAWQRGSRGSGLRVAIVGSRDAAASAVREMLRFPGDGLLPVAVFDNDTSVHGMSLVGVPVVGSIADIPSATSRYMLQEVLLAIPEASPEMIADVVRAAEAAGITMKVLPSMHDVINGLSGMFGIRRAREPRIEDLLGRTPVATDLEGVRQSLEGHRVLVTGAGGSIGSEICRQVAGFNPALLVLLDHDETHIHDTAAIVDGPCEQALVDITDRNTLFGAFEQYRPDVVLHTAAHKHVPMLEGHPVEAARTNVFGTLNVIDASAAVGVRRFVMISSDKAVWPSNVMGASKRVAEQVLLRRAPEDSAYCAVRFGNVLGSRGSVIPTFARQIASGGPVTVTDPRMTRFFMSVEEAVQLVLQASLLSEGRDIFMLEMGEPVSIIDLATRMIQLSGARIGVDISIKVVGIRPGEKLEEHLSEPEEQVLDTEHPFISRLIPITAPQPWFEACIGQLADATIRCEPDRVRRLLFAIAGSMPKNELFGATTPEIAAPEIPAPEMAAPEMAAPEMAAPEMAAPEMAAPEMAADEVPPAPPDGIELTCGQASGPPGPAGA